MTGAPGTDRDASHVARSGLVQLLSIIGQALMPVYQVLIARLYGVATFGVYQASAASVEVLVRAGQMGTVAGQQRFVAGHRATGDNDMALRALGTGALLAVGVSSVLALALALLAPVVARAWHEPGLVVALPLMAPAIPLTALTLVLVAATLGAKVARMSLYIRGITEPLSLLCAAIVAWRLGGGVRGIASAHLGAALVTALLALVACARVFGWRSLKYAALAPRHPAFVRFAVPLGASDLMNALLQRMDVFMVSTFAGLDALAIYTAAEYVTRVIANPRYVFDPILAPVISEALHARDPDRVRYNLALTTRWVTTAAAPLAATVIVLRAEILGLYGPRFAAGAGVMIVLGAAHLVNGCLGLTPYVIAMAGRSRLFFLDTLGAALINLGLGVWLVPRLGILGAAVGVLASVTALQVALAVQTWVFERVHCFSLALAKPLAAAVAAFAVESMLRALPLPPAARVAAVIAGGVAAYITVLLVLGLGSEERKLLQKLAARVTGPR